MKRLLAVLVGLSVAALIFSLGWFFLAHTLEIFNVGELTYTRKEHPSVTVSSDRHAFSYFYQLAFLTSMGAFLVLFAISMGLYAAAMVLRTIMGSHSRGGAIVYSGGTYMAVASFVVFAIWVVLRVFRYWVVA